MKSCSPSPEQAQAATELLRRRAARSNLLGFTTFTFPGYQAEPAHALIAEKLDAVVEGGVERLMIFAPPQHGKSELASVRLPSYWLAKRPDDPVILCSYAASLAETKSRQARQVVESPEFGLLFPEIAVSREARTVGRWEVEGRRGYVLAAGVGGGITGHGAMLGIIDDPLANFEASQSEVVRETAWEWFRSTFRSRIWQSGAIILICTRWHEDDLAGRLLKDQPGQWEVLRLPAIAEDQHERDESNKLLGLGQGQPDPLGRSQGEPLCPRRFSLPALEALRRDVGSMSWSALYQGTPRPPEGNRFKRSWFPVVTHLPAHKARRVRYYDKAATEGAGDFTVGVLMAKTDDGTYWIEDVLRGQWSAFQRDAIIKRTAEMDALKYGNAVSIWLEQEPGSGGKESAMNAIRMLAGHPVYRDRVTGSKEVRAEPFAAQAEAGNVKLVRGPWNGAFLDEVLSFPNGAHDDIVDAASGAFNKLAGGSQGAGQFRILAGRPGKYEGLRIIVCDKTELATLTVEEPSILVSIASPVSSEDDGHALARLVDSVVLKFADMDPAEEHERWTDSVADQVMKREDGKKLWASLVKSRTMMPECFVIADNGSGDRRAISVALAICDTLGLRRAEAIWRPGIEENIDARMPAPNAHVYSVTKSSRHMVAGGSIVSAEMVRPSAWRPLRGGRLAGLFS